ncbi:MAG: ABC transporter ATP-binding protein [Deltaproteobacteria bacterium]|jgi:peptide/nickel transport system ATP-binding protein|nr:ABC transporter ATP-binding protein [Deltaproteobacteria bacterium]
MNTLSPANTPDKTILDVRNLCVSYQSQRGRIDAIHNVSFTLGCEKVGIVGESGSGKSTLGRTIMGVLPESAHTDGQILFNDENLLTLSERRMREIRGGDISMILQDPKFSLNPVMRVGDQISEAFLAHSRSDKTSAKQQSLELMESVRIRNPERVYKLYPHEISGGMGQRIMIAMMLVAGPRLVIADEPTSALDVTVRMEVLSVLDEMVSRRHVGLLFISHDLNLVAKFCDRVLIMYAGCIVDSCRSSELRDSRHPYTQGLFASLPKLDEPQKRLAVLQRCETWLEHEEST